MDATIKIEKLTELLKDEATARKLFGMSIEEAQVELAKQGLDFSIEEMKAIAKGIVDSNNDDDELDEDQLTEVAGGAQKGDWYYQRGRDIGKICKWLFTIAAPFAVGLW